MKSLTGNVHISPRLTCSHVNENQTAAEHSQTVLNQTEVYITPKIVHLETFQAIFMWLSALCEVWPQK